MSATAKFKVGDRVRCVNSGFYEQLQDGEIYTVFRCGPTEKTVVILDEDGREGLYSVARFELAMGYTWTAFTDSHPTDLDADCKGLIWVIDATRGGAPQVASVAALSDADTFTHWRRTGIESLPEVVKEPEKADTIPTTGSDKLIEVSPGEGYRWLEVGEILQEGDEYLDVWQGWLKTGCAGKPALKGSAPYRRKIEAPNPPEPTTVDDPIQVGDYVEVLESPYLSIPVGSIRKVLNVCGGLFKVASSDPEFVDGLFLKPTKVRKVPAPSTPDTVSPPTNTTVDPGEGYRLLRLGEPITEGDEYLCGKDHWRTTTGIHAMLDRTMPPYRRKVSPPKEPEYRPFKDASEFKPHRDKWIFRKDTPSQLKRIGGYGPESITLATSGLSILYQTLFTYYLFEDGTPCGVEVTDDAT